MGLLVLKSKMCSEMDLNIKEKQYFRKQNVHTQILFLTFHSYNLETAFLYICETPNQEETKILKKDLEKVDLVMGDLNIDADDPKRIADKKKLDTLCVKRTRILMEVTTTRYNQLDHILLNIEKFPVFYSTSFMNHTTDHHTIITRIAKAGNNKKQSFLKRASFDADEYTKPKRRKMDMFGGVKEEKDDIKPKTYPVCFLLTG